MSADINTLLVVYCHDVRWGIVTDILSDDGSPMVRVDTTFTNGEALKSMTFAVESMDALLDELAALTRTGRYRWHIQQEAATD